MTGATLELLRAPRFEVLPLDGIADDIEAHLAPGSRVTVTASPSRGLEPTLALAERLAAGGYLVVPHVAARLVRDGAHLDEVLDRVLAAGVREVFVPAGDAREPAGPYAGSADLLRAMGERRGAFAEIGIAGYPEGHPHVPPDRAMQALQDKAPMATQVVTQMCFDAGAIARWIRGLRESRIALPVWVGLPGIVPMRRLVRISGKIGLGESARFALHQHGVVRRLLARQFRPDDLLRDLGPHLRAGDAQVAGLHLYTFNEVARTERWRRRLAG